MMDVHEFLEILEDLGDAFFTGVPDSLLSPLTDAIMDRYGISDKHIVAANEGAAVGLAAGHYLATSRPAVVYMQNSGIGNAVNPICSLLHEKVFSIPVVFVIGWRGEPGTVDEPQHVFQGEITLPLLDCLEIPYAVVDDETSDLQSVVVKFRQHLDSGRSVAFVVRKNALWYGAEVKYLPPTVNMSREDALLTILEAGKDMWPEGNIAFVCTTGKLSREVFEIREGRGLGYGYRCGSGHGSDFLTVGSMGHSLMIAYGIALAKPKMRVFCLDGDGAALMHMGSLAIVGAHAPANLVHVVINNGAHETVGGLPTVCGKINLSETARALGYRKTVRVATSGKLGRCISDVRDSIGPVFIEVICGMDSRRDLGRPTTTPVQNKDEFMANLADGER